jgi:hypothetical protein
VIIPHAHKHLFIAWDDYTRRDGVRLIWSKCVCGLEERRHFDEENEPLVVEYRLGGIWVDSLVILRLAPLQVALCDVCGGNIDVLGPKCHHCRGLGVIEEVSGGPVKLNPPAKFTEPVVVNPAE